MNLTNNQSVNENNKGKRLQIYCYGTSLLFFLFALFYCQLLIYLSRKSVFFEVSVSIGLIIIALPFLKKGENFHTVKRLLIIETYFNFICIALKLTSLLEITRFSTLFDWMFLVFFILQIGGFIVFQTKEKAWLSLPSTISMSIAIFYWAYQCVGQGSGLGSNNEIYFWGSDVPLYLQWTYGFWLLTLVVIQYASALPKLTFLLVHLASYCVALTSSEFFHARVLTACHLFVLNALFVFAAQDWINQHFASINHLTTFKTGKIPHYILALALNIGTISCTLLYIFNEA